MTKLVQIPLSVKIAFGLTLGVGVIYYGKSIFDRIRENKANKNTDEKETQQALDLYIALGKDSIIKGGDYDKVKQIALQISDFDKVQKRYNQKYQRDLVTDIQDELKDKTTEILQLVNTPTNKTTPVGKLVVCLKKGANIILASNLNTWAPAFSKVYHTASQNLYVKDGYSKGEVIEANWVTGLPKMNRFYVVVNGTEKEYVVAADFSETVTQVKFNSDLKKIYPKYVQLY